MSGARTRVFINHPKIGTVIVPKSRPHFKSKRFAIMNKFMWALSMQSDINCIISKCKRCNKSLMNPQSILMHIGNGCEKNQSNHLTPLFT